MKNSLGKANSSNVRYKAGDFTSGKMGEIFKKCHHSIDLVFIDHKQFGAANLISEDYIIFMVCRALRGSIEYKNYIENEYKGEDPELMDDDKTFELFNDVLCSHCDCEGFKSWFDMMIGLFLMWGKCYDQDLQNT